MSELRRYRNIGSDSARWSLFDHRPDDIIISTPPKTGTTLTQRLCALAIFESGELHQPMDQLSPWFDQHHRTDESALALVESMEHRRFIKTHSPLDGIPYWEDVTYLTTARDPRDIFASWEGQLDNLDVGRVRASFTENIGAAAVAELASPRPETLDGRIDAWLDGDEIVNFSLARHLLQIRLGWERQDRSNVWLFHFDDLRADGRTALQTVANAIDANLSSQQLDELSPFAGFDVMRSEAANLAPNTNGIFNDPERFFRSGKGGGWQELMTDQQLDRYWQRCEQLAAPELISWIHRL